MIEVIYKKESEPEDQADSQKTETIKLPKNIRQIGVPGKSRKIYIEDYVVTYLSSLAMPSNTYSRGAILLGTVKHTGDSNVIFINGALEAQNLELDLDETVFTNDTWAGIYSDLRNYFPDLEVVGWFLSRLGFSTELNEKIIKTHLEHFSGQNKTLYMIDSLEGEDAFYLFENDGLKKQRGYYIFYEKNEAMQTYMIDRKGEAKPKVLEKPSIIKKDQNLIHSYKKALEQKKVDRPAGFFYIASTVLTVAILAVGITIVNNYDKMKILEATVQQMSSDLNNSQEVMSTISTVEQPKVEDILEENSTIAEPTGQDLPKTDSNNSNSEIKTNINGDANNDITSNKKPDSTVSSNTTPNQPSSTGNKQNTDAAKQNADVANKKKNNKKNVKPVSSSGTVVYYTVKEGDTLIGISKKMYQSSKYVKNLLNANDLDVEETIFPGQKIIIPSVN